MSSVDLWFLPCVFCGDDMTFRGTISPPRGFLIEVALPLCCCCRLLLFHGKVRQHKKWGPQTLLFALNPNLIVDKIFFGVLGKESGSSSAQEGMTQGLSGLSAVGKRPSASAAVFSGPLTQRMSGPCSSMSKRQERRTHSDFRSLCVKILWSAVHVIISCPSGIILNSFRVSAVDRSSCSAVVCRVCASFSSQLQKPWGGCLVR
jgi:hypothetical protein